METTFPSLCISTIRRFVSPGVVPQTSTMEYRLNSYRSAPRWHSYSSSLIGSPLLRMEMGRPAVLMNWRDVSMPSWR